MKATNRFLCDMLDFDMVRDDVIWRACNPTEVSSEGGAAIALVPFEAQKVLEQHKRIGPDPGIPRAVRKLAFRAYGDTIVRVSLTPDGSLPGDEGDMLEWDPDLKPEPLSVRTTESGWEAVDPRGNVRVRIDTKERPIRLWDRTMPAPAETIRLTILPDGQTAVPFMAYDTFTSTAHDSLALAYVEKNGHPYKTVFSLHARHDEKFAGTGERFAGTNLSGRTLNLINEDGLGANSRRAYKNVPFYVSSKGYGLFMHTSAPVRLSLADISTRAAQAVMEEDTLDLFFIGGGKGSDRVARIVRDYMRITGFPHETPPLWSFGTWMSRMSYYSEDEALDVADKLRQGGFPCDVIHLDIGWFEKNWHCDWEFGRAKFPDPEGFMRDMRHRGFRVSLWQNISIGKKNKHYAEAAANRYIPPKIGQVGSGSNFGEQEFGGKIDFTNPKAVEWYQGLLGKLLDIGASVIKTDFGEDIDMEADYVGLPAHLLRNRYCLLYQKAVYEITKRKTGAGLTWARAGWAGCQRYPVHWGGDPASTWDGLAGTIRGGLHLGLSGFPFWSHDVPGFHGVPDFMNHWPEDELYVRWTQVGVFTSHLRYHGASPREPYEYPAVADIVRRWLRLRYALIPYIVDQSEQAVRTGLPLFRSMLFRHADDPLCWALDDQYYFGDSFLVAPILNAEGVRDVYLPEGEWVDLWTGEPLRGPVLLRQVKMPLERLPVYAAKGHTIRIYPYPVQCTDEMKLEQAVPLRFDETYQGLEQSPLAHVFKG